jgi:hypothetical protein
MRYKQYVQTTTHEQMRDKKFVTKQQQKNSHVLIEKHCSALAGNKDHAPQQSKYYCFKRFFNVFL